MAWFKKQNIIIKIVIGLVVLGLVYCVCSIPIAIISPDRTATTEEVAKVEKVSDLESANVSTETSTPAPTDTPVPTNTSEPLPTNTPVPTNTSLPPTNTPEVTNTPVLASDSGNGYSSGGLGLSRLDWEQKHTETSLDYQPIGTGYDNKYDVMFQVGNVWYIERQWNTNDFVTVDEVKIESQNLIPLDSQLIETYNPEGRPETVVNLYFSESLKNRFKNEDSLFGNWWTGGESGNFTVQYNVYDGEVGRMIISIGNNP